MDILKHDKPTIVMKHTVCLTATSPQYRLASAAEPMFIFYMDH